jgi:two-component system, NarL family, sensor histidine kinase NreB
MGSSVAPGQLLVSRLGTGTGLIGLKDRVEALGGQFTLRSAPGEGTTVTARLPLSR